MSWTCARARGLDVRPRSRFSRAGARRRYRRGVTRTTPVGPGDRLADRRLVGLLGSGGEGEVWEALRPDGSRCALKLVRPEVLPAPEEVRRRGQWLVRIDHPSMVRVSRGGRFTGGMLEGWGFVEMDLLDGPSLQDAEPIPDALLWLDGVAQALDLLHAGAWSDGVPLIHRDVKPGNLIDAGGHLVLVDPSTMRGLDTRDLTRVGTPAYVAPEVASGRFGPLADVYGLAATAAALVTGARGSSLAAVLAEPWAYGLPDRVCAALEDDPRHRPATCAAVIEDRGLIVVPGGWDPPGPAVDEGYPAPPGPGWAMWALAATTVPASVVWALGQTRPSLVDQTAVLVVLLAAYVTTAGLHMATGRTLAGLLAPPWAWGDLLADRHEGAGKRSAWLSDVTAGTLSAMLLAAVTAALADATPALVPAVVVGGLGLLLVLRRLSRVSRRTAWAPIWTLSLPLRLLGAIPRVLVDPQR
ncbi:hypothetical protein BH23ACT9_BH23ACT9_03860 [soil metagenome]